MADQSIDVSKLPLEVRAKLAELDLELSEGKKPPNILEIRQGNDANFDILKPEADCRVFFVEKVLA